MSSAEVFRAFIPYRLRPAPKRRRRGAVIVFVRFDLRRLFVGSLCFAT
jgi:hypothetical protein